MVSSLLSMCGCGNSLPETVVVHGKVTWQGQPLPNGMITFEPVKNGPNIPLRPAKGYTNNDGTYRLSTFRTGDGAMPGEYVVLVHALDSLPPMEATTPSPKSVIPLKYNRSDTSDLSASIPADGTTALEINFDLVP